MKNKSLFILLAAVLPLFSCGTMSYSAFQGGGQFRNSIYYAPGNRTSAVQVVERGESATEQRQYQPQGTQNDTRTVYVGDADHVEINYEPGASYTIMDDEESYAARLRKFDSPTYTVNINFVEPYWWDVDLWWYGPRWHWNTPSWHWHSYWYNPWYSRWYGHWSDPWWSRPHWAWHNHWYDPWWGPVHRPVYAPWPGHDPAGGPGYHPGHGRPVRDVYYGKRHSGSSYSNVNRGNVTSGKPGGTDNKNNGGSVTRKPSRNQQGGNVKPQQKSSQQSSHQQNSGSYTRNSNSYNRSGSSSYNSGAGRSSSGNSGATRSSGGGSSYRRR